MQVPTQTDPTAALERAVARDLPDGRGRRAWTALLKAHATLVRQLEVDLERETGLRLADFDVLAQLALGGGELRMTELAERALISRSGMTRRVTRLAEEDLVRRDGASGDGRGVVVGLTELGLSRLEETAALHARGIATMFVGRLEDSELASLERALEKVVVDCTFD